MSLFNAPHILNICNAALMLIGLLDIYNAINMLGLNALMFHFYFLLLYNFYGTRTLTDRPYILL